MSMITRPRTVLTQASISLVCALGLGVATGAQAASSSAASVSPMGGNGHNVNFDGRIFIVTQGPTDATGGWFLFVFRPENVRYKPGGRVDLEQGAFSERAQIQPWENGENALAICEPNPDNTPYPCDDAGAADMNGAYACYEFVIIDSNAFPNQYNGLRRRPLKVWVAEPETATAHYHKHAWTGGYEPVRGNGNVDLRGIEATVTRDGKLLAWQGHPDNDGKIDTLMYATNPTPCGGSGWDGPYSISHMYNDPKVVGKYPLGERQLRAADGVPFSDGQIVRGGYPWLFPEGDALTFAATVMPCQGQENPPGCGARRNSLSVIGYPTNWGVGPIDGGLNPTNNDQVRLFFSSPGATMFEQVPLTGGTDVWPMFGSNTANYADVVFDDALDGQFAGVWHMNESVNTAGDLQFNRTPDTSGYFNTAVVNGATFPAANNGLFGKALVFDGANDWLEVAHNDSLNPVNALSIEMWVNPASPVSCDGNNNWRALLGKGPVGQGAYSFVLEQEQRIQARVLAGGEQRAVWSAAGIPVGEWTHIGMSYDGATGAMRLYFNGELAGEADYPPATLDGSPHNLFIGGPGGNAGACPNGNGVFHGAIDELRISRVVRDLTFAPRPGSASAFVSQTVPMQVEAGQPFTAEFTFRNMGTTAWSGPLRMSLGSQAPQDNSTWGTGRVGLPSGRVQPGNPVTITAELTAPAEVGVYPMQWKMVHEGVEWFGQASQELMVEVVPYVEPPETETETETDTGTTGGTGSTGGDTEATSTTDAGQTTGDETGAGSSGGETAGPTGPALPPGASDSGDMDGEGGCACHMQSTQGTRLGLLWACGVLVLLRRRRG